MRRRVFTDAGELIREGLAPKDVPNTRKDLMAWWAEEDKRLAAKEAAVAAAAAEAAAEPVVAGPEDQIVELADRLAALQEELSAVRERLQVVDQLELASPESIAACAMAAAMAAGSAEATITAGQKAREELQGVADAATERLDVLEGQVGETAAAVGQLLVDGQQRLDQVGAEMLAKTTAAISKRIAGLEVQASQLRGPKGDRGRVGQGLIAGAGKRPEQRPDGSDWAPGDSWLDTKAEGFQLSYLGSDGQWSKPARLVPSPRLINATQNVLDMAPRSTNSIQIVQPGSGGGGGGLEKFLVSTVARGSTVDLASNANWASAGYDSTGGELWIEVSDTSSAKSGVVACAFDVGAAAGDTRLTEYALTGVLFEGTGQPDVDLDVIRGGIPPIPASVTGVSNIGTAHTVVRVTIGGNIGGSATYIVRGGVIWLQQAQGIAIPNDQTGPRPNWTWG